MNQYLVVREDNPHELAAAVKLKLDDGWELQGGVASGRQSTLQAMVKREP